MRVIFAFLLAATKCHAEVPTDTYQKTCKLPSFEWAAYGTRLTGRMYTRRAALLGDSLYAAGYLKSTNAPNKEGFVDIEDDFAVTGPYTSADPTGASAFWITSDLISYSTEYGSYAQYEVGVVKINIKTGRPEDVFVYYGEGQDETSGLAAKETTNGEKLLAISGHFVGSLSADLKDGSKSTIYNSNAEGTKDYVQHPNAVKNGFDDGFVISADAETGKANWIIAYPKSTKDAETVGVDMDEDGNIYGAGYSCDQPSGSGDAVCNGFVAKFDAADGRLIWEQIFTELGAAMWVVYDKMDDSLYVTGTTTFFGEEKDSKLHTNCVHKMCAVTMRLSATNGMVDWVRTVEATPRWNIFDQTGDIRLAGANDGPYIYVALDDAGENGEVTLDEGTSYAACIEKNGGGIIPEYEINLKKVIAFNDCPSNYLFVSRNSLDAFSASSAGTGASCGTGHDNADACVIKYHKYTGLPVWGASMPPVASLVPSPDGLSVMAVGFYYPSWGHFDSVVLPDYNGVEGSYNAKLDAMTGRGEYVMHSGGVSKDRPYDAVGSPEGDIYIVGYTQSAVINWGGTLETKIIEEGVDQNDDAGTAFQMGKVSSSTSEYQFFAVKLATSEEGSSPECMSTCLLDRNIASSTIRRGSCLIDNVCYESGATAELFGRPCLICDPNQSQTEWSKGPTVGVLECFIGNVCRDEGEFLTYRQSRRVTHQSLCQVCNPKTSASEWSVASNFELILDALPPNDCESSFTELEGPDHPGDIKLPGWDFALPGVCRGGPRINEKVNGKYSNSAGKAAGKDGILTQLECAQACFDEPECIGYTHGFKWCGVHSPNLQLAPGDGWEEDVHNTNKITGTEANRSYICVTGPYRK